MNSCLSTSFTARISPPSKQCELRHRPSHLCRTSLILRPSLTHRAPTSIVCMAEPYMITKLESAEKTWKELSVKLADPDVVSNNSEYQKLVQSMADLDEVVSTFRTFKDCEKQLEESKALAKEAVGDVDMAEMIASEIETLSNQLKELEEKLKDKGLRELATNALAALVKYDPEYFANYVLEKLITFTLSSDLCMRHGSTLAAGEVVFALHQHDYTLSIDKQKHVAGIVPAIEKARLYRGKGGEIMRSTVSRFIERISSAHVHLPEKVKRTLLDTLTENLRHPNSHIQNAAVEALKHFVPAYLVSADDKSVSDIMSRYLEQLTDPNVAARRGSAFAIGVLPFELLAKRWKIVILKLCSACAVEDKPEDRDAEARVNAVKGLVSVCETLTALLKN